MRRARAVTILLLTAVFTACNTSGTDSGVPLSPPSSAPSTSIKADTTATQRQAARPPGVRRAVTVPPRPATTRTTGDPVADAAQRGVGALAGHLLADGPVRRIVYELLLQDGLSPRQRTIDHVVGELRAFSGNKPVAVERTPGPPGPSQWTADQLHDYVDRHRRFRSGGDTAVVHVAFVHGGMPDAVGAAVRADIIAIFPDSFRGGGLTATEGQIEDVVTMHETGHILGLVDLWLSLGRGDTRDDPAPGGHHSRNPESVMHWRVETLDVKSFFRGGPPSEFDADDRADLSAIRAGAPYGARSR